ncbi:MAG: alanine:cation symporter family protein [Bdellovibrionales bacterium]|nr:alanine:cation symporter family protein [Bdellovibrionales bacterium]
MPQFVSQFFSVLVDWVWGLPLIIVLMGGGTILFLYSGLLPLRGFSHAIKLVTGKLRLEGDDQAQGQITHFQALSNALAATVGLGNIAGVAVAITQGGPGAVVWMWIAAVIGMNTKFFECTLALMYRGKDYRGEVQGGPMYVIVNALPKAFTPLAYFFAFCGLIGCMALFQINQLSGYMQDQYQIEPISVGVVCFFLVFFILKGGLKRLSKVTSALVPVMAVFYILACLAVLIANAEKIPGLLSAIVSDAFTGEAMFGGAAGYGFLEVMRVGVKRAAFSNEAGVGTAPMAHGNAKTSEPVSEGLVAMLGPFLDTMIICTMTALVVLIAVPIESVKGLGGITITARAFEVALPGMGSHVLGIAVLLFSITTMIGMANYNEKCWNFMFKGARGLGENAFITVFCSTLLIGAVSELGDVVNILDTGYGLMAFPNMMATLILAPKVKQAMKEYFSKYKL